MNNEVQALIEDLRRFAQARDWAPFHSPKNLSMALAAEAGELLENFQWLTEAQSRTLDAAKLEAVRSEVADVLLYLLQLSDALGIDPLEAARRKLAFNEQRYPVALSRGNARKHDEL